MRTPPPEPVSDMALMSPIEHRLQAGGSQALNTGQVLPPLSPELQAYLERHVNVALLDFMQRLQQIGEQKGQDWLQAIQQAGQVRGENWVQTIQEAGRESGRNWIGAIEWAGRARGLEWVQAIEWAGQEQGLEWVNAVQKAGQAQGLDWMEAIRRAGEEKGQAWLDAIIQEGREKGAAWVEAVLKEGQAKGAAWEQEAKRVGQNLGDEFSAEMQREREAQTLKYREDMDELASAFGGMQLAKEAAVNEITDAGKKGVKIIEEKAKEAMADRRSVDVNDANEDKGDKEDHIVDTTEEKLEKLEKLLQQVLEQNRKLEERLAKYESRSSTPSRETTPIASDSRSSTPTDLPRANTDFTRSDRTSLSVPPGQEKRAKSIPGVKSQPSSYGGEWIYVEPGKDLLPAKEFWRPDTHDDYDKHLGRETFTRSTWTILDVKPGDNRWEEAKKLPHVKVLEHGAKLGVPKDKNLMPTQDFWPERAREDYVARDDDKEVREKWTRLSFSPDTAEWKRAKAVRGVREFTDDHGQRALGIAKNEDVLPAKKADIYFPRTEWTVLEVSANEQEKWERVKSLNGVKVIDNGSKLAVPPGEDLLSTKKYWPEKALADYAGRHNEQFKREAWTHLNVKPGDDNWERAKALPNVKVIAKGKMLSIPPKRDIMGAEKFWTNATRREYEGRQAKSAEISRAREDRARAMGL
jgi:hypothetical protein